MKWNYLIMNDTKKEMFSVFPKSASAHQWTDEIGVVESNSNVGVHLDKLLDMNMHVLAVSVQHRVDSPLPDSTDSGTCGKRHGNIPFELLQYSAVWYRK